MSSRQKKTINRHSLERKISNKTLTNEDGNLNQKKLTCNSDRKDVIMSELLKSLLSYVATDFKFINSFANIHFRNSNSYCGWLQATGFNGFGTYTFENGALFRGGFDDSLTRGLGRYIYKNGDIYEGEFIAGRRHGNGSFKTQQFRYDGCFLNGNFHGPGIWKSRTEEVRGEFYQGVIQKGETRDYSGIFKGNFDQSGSRKLGKFFFRNGDTYNGSWSDGLFSGFGVYNWNREDSLSLKAEVKYEGYWLNGKRHGLGMLTLKHRVVLCQWSCDRKSGAGLIQACNGSCFASEDLFIDNQYLASHRIENCSDNRDIVSETINLVTVDTSNERTIFFVENIKKLIVNHWAALSFVNPVCIPNYEISSLPATKFHNCPLELKYLQQVLVENCFIDFYKKYTHPKDDCMNVLGLNLFYMDIFHKTQDVNVCKCMRDGQALVKQKIFSNNESCIHPLTTVSFYEFFQHFVHVTEILMENKVLSSRAEKMRPMFFGRLAIRVLLMLKILKSNEDPLFLVREGLVVDRPAILKILLLLDKGSNYDKSSRAILKFLNKNDILAELKTDFLEENGFESKNNVVKGLLSKTETELTDLELVELVLRACQLVIGRQQLKGFLNIKYQSHN